MPKPRASPVHSTQMIAGLGNDLTSISRVWGLYQRRGDQFLRKFLHPEEKSKFSGLLSSRPELHPYKSASYLAGRWAVKEATFKAVGRGRMSEPHKPLPFTHLLVAEDINGTCLFLVHSTNAALLLSSYPSMGLSFGWL